MSSTDNNPTLQCVVCGNDCTPTVMTCPVCGFEQRIYISDIPDEEVQRIEAARKRWEENLAREERLLNKCREETKAHNTQERVDKARQQALKADLWRTNQPANTSYSYSRVHLSKTPQVQCNQALSKFFNEHVFQ